MTEDSDDILTRLPARLKEARRAQGLSLEAVAVRLGYGEVSNFVHAFRRWKGMTPRQYCRSERG